mmetsp:Transcript_23358/g.35868  ORF Transcript_23358/g.35868 Transcript_23358/m.35868 type:complete len:230 (+) Transcript_23358:59-748(+)
MLIRMAMKKQKNHPLKKRYPDHVLVDPAMDQLVNFLVLQSEAPILKCVKSTMMTAKKSHLWRKRLLDLVLYNRSTGQSENLPAPLFEARTLAVTATTKKRNHHRKRMNQEDVPEAPILTQPRNSPLRQEVRHANMMKGNQHLPKKLRLAPVLCRRHLVLSENLRLHQGTTALKSVKMTINLFPPHQGLVLFHYPLDQFERLQPEEARVLLDQILERGAALHQTETREDA